MFTYRFEHPMTSKLWGGAFGTGPDSVFVGHATELPFVFNEDGLTPGEEADLGKIMSGYWSSFAMSGDPNEPRLDPAGPNWPRFEVCSKCKCTIV